MNTNSNSILTSFIDCGEVDIKEVKVEHIDIKEEIKEELFDDNYKYSLIKNENFGEEYKHEDEDPLSC